MEKKPEVDGSWKEVDADSVIANVEALNAAQIIVIRDSRLELAGEDKVKFMDKFSHVMSESESEVEGMDESQKSYYVIRKMLVG